MSPDGVLLLGGAETVMGISDRFKSMGGEHGLYTLTSAPVGAVKTAAG